MTSNDSHAETVATISLHEQVAEWENQLLNDHDKISLHEVEGLLMRCVKLSQVLVDTVQKKQKEERDRREQQEESNRKSLSTQQDDAEHITNGSSRMQISSPSGTPVPIPAEVLRLIIPHLTPNEMGRVFLLTSPQIIPILGHKFVWKELCLKLWPDSMTSSRLGADWWFQTSTSTSDHNAFKWYFVQRQKSILLQQDGRLKPLPKPSWNPDYLTLGIDIYNEKGQLVHTRTIDNFLSQVDDLLSTGTVTIHLEQPIPVGSLPRGRGCHCWNLPKSYPGWRARLHLFSDNGTKISGGDDTMEKTNLGVRASSFHGRQCHTLLDTSFSVWRGFSENGELTFVQKERTKGLQLTDRGRFLQHRIVTGASRTPNWRNFLGLQAKVILQCEKTYDGGNPNHPSSTEADKSGAGVTPTTAFSPIQQFSFTNLKIQAIRLHENASSGNIQHWLFRKDSGWSSHGVELLHLLEELM